MGNYFPSRDWVEALQNKLNTDPVYAHTAREWEGDLLFVIEPDDLLDEGVIIYLDLWHGKCRQSSYTTGPNQQDAEFIFQAPYRNFSNMLTGKWETMQALLTRKLHIQGKMTYLVRNVPTVLEFVRCCREVTGEVLGEDAGIIDAADTQN